MTNAGTTITATLSGALDGGPTTGGFNLHIQITLQRGGSTASTTCVIQSHGGEISGLAASSRSMVSNTFSLSYTDCAGFIENDPQRTFHNDDTVLTLSKG